MIQAVVFDLGKVLVDFDYRIAIDRVAARGKMSASEISAFVSRSPLLIRYETGLLSSEEFYNEVRIVTGYDGTIQDFATSFGDIFTPIESMIQLHGALRRKLLPTYIFSNTNDFAVRYIRSAFPFFADFDGYIFSYEHHAMKPDAGLYEVVERTCNHRGAEILYFDDRPENVQAGLARGWQAVLQETPEKSHAAVRRLGLL
jgi:FMN phosphatase YigB (HAD superfamily)